MKPKPFVPEPYDADSRYTHLHPQFLYLDSPGQYSNMKASDAVVKAGLFEAFDDDGKLKNPKQQSQAESIGAHLAFSF